jgi:DNA-binding GntR family transcriptional regulator
MDESTQFKLPALPDLISNALRDDISRGVFKPGDQIRMRLLADRFGVSAMPVREALRRLEAEGLVQFEKNRRISVTQLSSEEMDEVSQIRLELEPLALRNAVPRLREDPEALAELDDLIAAMDAETDADAWRTLNEQFHRRLYHASGMPRLETIVNTLMGSIEAYIRIYVRTKENLAHSQAQHRELLDRVRAGDTKGAEEVLRAHIQYSRDRLQLKLAGEPSGASSG